MIQRDLKGAADDADGADRPARSRVATWRYVGDRAAVDHAYCARFGVPVAPEPTVTLGGVWAYALPAV